MKPGCLFVLLCASHIGWAQAEIYKHTDPEGHVTYSSTPMKGSKKLDLEVPLPIPSSPARMRGNPGTSRPDFPKVDNETQKSRDGTRLKILSDELAAEEKLLAEARQNLNAAEADLKKALGSDGKSQINTAKYDENINALQEQVSLHEKNVGALKTELSNLK